MSEITKITVHTLEDVSDQDGHEEPRLEHETEDFISEYDHHRHMKIKDAQIFELRRAIKFLIGRGDELFKEAEFSFESIVVHLQDFTMVNARQRAAEIAAVMKTKCMNWRNENAE